MYTFIYVHMHNSYIGYVETEREREKERERERESVGAREETLMFTVDMLPGPPELSSTAVQKL